MTKPVLQNTMLLLGFTVLLSASLIWVQLQLNFREATRRNGRPESISEAVNYFRHGGRQP